MRGRRFGVLEAVVGSCGWVFVEFVAVVAERSCDLLMYVNARVRAPAIEVVGVSESGDVVL